MGLRSHVVQHSDSVTASNDYVSDAHIRRQPEHLGDREPMYMDRNITTIAGESVEQPIQATFRCERTARIQAHTHPELKAAIDASCH